MTSLTTLKKNLTDIKKEKEICQSEICNIEDQLSALEFAINFSESSESKEKTQSRTAEIARLKECYAKRLVELEAKEEQSNTLTVTEKSIEKEIENIFTELSNSRSSIFQKASNTHHSDSIVTPKALC